MSIGYELEVVETFVRAIPGGDGPIMDKDGVSLTYEPRWRVWEGRTEESVVKDAARFLVEGTYRLERQVTYRTGWVAL